MHAFTISFDFAGSEIEVENLAAYLEEMLGSYGHNVRIQVSLGGHDEAGGAGSDTEASG